MPWTRLDDLWIEMDQLKELPYEVRWHYLGILQWCSRHRLYDGELRIADARRASDVDDPATAIAMLAGAKLLEITDNAVRVVQIKDHVPPPNVREASEANALRTRRWRLHKAGDHSICLPENCSGTPGDVARDGTCDGTAQDQDQAPWAEVLPPSCRSKSQVKISARATKSDTSNGERDWAAVGADPPEWIDGDPDYLSYAEHFLVCHREHLDAWTNVPGDRR